MPDVEVRGLEKRFGGGETAVHALGPVDLAIDEGEIVALVGPSGCGKTTLIRTVAGLTAPTAGSVEINGRAVWDASGRVDGDAVENLAFVFQEANLLPWFTVETNVALPLRLRGVARAEARQRAREWCDITGLAGFERHRPAALSVGMRQRAALARALIGAPRLLLLDEPFAALDAITREAMNLELQRVWMTHPCTSVLVTHSIAEAVLLADRVVSVTSRPGRITGITRVPFDRPRPVEIQHEPKFQHLVADIRALLVEAF